MILMILIDQLGADQPREASLNYVKSVEIIRRLMLFQSLTGSQMDSAVDMALRPPPGIRIEVPNLIRPQPDGQQALRRPVIHNIPADDLIQEINAIERRARRDRQRREQHDFLLRMMERAEYRPRGVDPIRPITRPTGRRNPVANDIDPDPMQELTYQMSTLTNEFRNLRDALQNLTNSLYTNSEANTANSEQLARIAQSNEEILDGINE